jgi:hypothetical protein
MKSMTYTALIILKSQRTMMTKPLDATSCPKELLDLEEDEIVSERNILVKRKYKEGISKREQVRLRYLEWQIDRIEDAIAGESIDELEALVESQERLVQTMEKWGSVVSQHVPVRAQHSRRRR